MTTYTSTPHGGKAPTSPFRTLGAIPLGDGASLDVQIVMSGGARVVNMRNALRSRAGTLPGRA